MFKSLLILVVLSLFLGIGAWLVFIWSMKKGAFDDIERPKYRMLDDDEPPAGPEGQQDGKESGDA
jgi:cbb3-type cytochrome oxidase maturation protein